MDRGTSLGPDGGAAVPAEGGDRGFDPWAAVPRAAGAGAEVAELTALATRFRERGYYDAAGELLALALSLDPRSIDVKMALTDVRRLQRQVPGSRPRSVREQLREEFRRHAIDASHFVGLAALYADQGDEIRAAECLDVAKARDLASPELHKLSARLLRDRRELDHAADEYEVALRLDPFDREIAEELGRTEYERRRFEQALALTVHAFLLTGDRGGEHGERLRLRIRTLKRIVGYGTRELARVFHARQELLQTSFDRLQWRRERFLEEGGMTADRGVAPAAPAAARPGRRIAMAARLRRLRVWHHLSDEHVFHLSRVVEEELFDPGSVVVEHLSHGRDLFLVESGEVSIQRSTSYGTFVLATLAPPEIFGEASFITGAPRSGDAVTVRPSHLFRFHADALDRLVQEQPELGVQLYWSFWHGLARKLRSTNEQLQTFFDPVASPENFLRLRRDQSEPPVATGTLARDAKLRLFTEQGLTGEELTTLATFSRERRFAEGARVFTEGDRGQELYIVADGRVLISKYIPGGGEEALAILGRGDFFGEMALIDGEPRSASARAHGGPLTVLALDQESVREILSLDPRAALDFLQLLCRLVAQRLGEIDEKVIGWRILSGGQAESVPA